mmetsp:Transcript_19065/g.35398  ORF Transcript_19065/g.35398 Transcript_19065/m.35398 type:complete len:216 (-) Transcript_19065:1403-2050(-)
MAILPPRGITSLGPLTLLSLPQTRKKPPFSSVQPSRFRYSKTVSLRPSLAVLSTCFWKREPEPGYTASMASEREVIRASLSSFLASSSKTNLSMLSRTFFRAANFPITLALIFLTPPLSILLPTFILTSISHGSIAPLALGCTPAESKSVLSTLAWPPHIHSTLSPRTSGTEIWAPTSAPLPTQISDGVKCGWRLSISERSSTTFAGLTNPSRIA